MLDRGKGALQIFAGQTEIKGNQPGLIRGLHLMQGLTGMGAGPAVRLARDGHFPREQGLVVTGCTLTVITSRLAARDPDCALPGPSRCSGGGALGGSGAGAACRR